MTQMRSTGVHIGALSGEVSLRVRDPTDEIQVGVQREVYWVHTVPSPAWVQHNIVLTKIVKLCRVAHRRDILWSVDNSGCFTLWTCKEIPPLWDIGILHQVVRSGSQVLTDVHWWSPDVDCRQVVHNFMETLNMQVPDLKVADLTISVDRIPSRGSPEISRVTREDENEEAIGGLRNAARPVDRVPSWKEEQCETNLQGTTKKTHCCTMGDESHLLCPFQRSLPPSRCWMRSYAPTPVDGNSRSTAGLLDCVRRCCSSSPRPQCSSFRCLAFVCGC